MLHLLPECSFQASRGIPVHQQCRSSISQMNLTPKLDEIKTELESKENSLAAGLSSSLLDPIPIATNGAKVVQKISLSESNLLREDDALIKCVIGVLRKKQKTTHSPQDCYSSLPSIAKVQCENYTHSQQVNLNMTNEKNQWSCEETYSICYSSSEESSPNDKVNIRSHQTTLWSKRFEELCKFREKMGHCLVPHNWKENPALAKWVKRQRYQHKLKTEGSHSTLTDDRRKKLDLLGFVWDAHSAVWEQRLNELRRFKEIHGHCNVSSAYKENRSLSIWVQCQRRQYLLFRKGVKGANMSADRISKLNELNFVWDPRQRSKKRSREECK